MNDDHVRLRPEKAADVPFLRRLYATTRVDVTFSGLPAAQKQQFINMQFDAQRHHYRTRYQNTRFLIIELSHVPVGRLYLSQMPDQLRVMDITVLPDYRHRGIGSRLLRDIQDEGCSLGLPVTLHAEKLGNMADYYRQLGFDVVEEKECHFFMKWTAPSSVIIN